MRQRAGLELTSAAQTLLAEGHTEHALRTLFRKACCYLAATRLIMLTESVTLSGLERWFNVKGPDCSCKGPGFGLVPRTHMAAHNSLQLHFQRI